MPLFDLVEILIRIFFQLQNTSEILEISLVNYDQGCAESDSDFDLDEISIPTLIPNFSKFKFRIPDHDRFIIAISNDPC